MCINICIFVYKTLEMRTSIVLNEQLVNEAMQLSHAHTKKEVVDLALQNFIDSIKRRNIQTLFGEVKWEGDLNKMREI